jgi:Cd2+/Zn2+-exporting ATPase
MGIGSVMLTEDNERTGRAIAGAVVINVCAGLLPEQSLQQTALLHGSAGGPGFGCRADIGGRLV